MHSHIIDLLVLSKLRQHKNCDKMIPKNIFLFIHDNRHSTTIPVHVKNKFIVM